MEAGILHNRCPDSLVVVGTSSVSILVDTIFVEQSPLNTYTLLIVIKAKTTCYLGKVLKIVEWQRQLTL